MCFVLNPGFSVGFSCLYPYFGFTMIDFFFETNAVLRDIEWRVEPFSEPPWSLSPGLQPYKKQGKGWRFHGLAMPETMINIAEDENWFVLVYGFPYASSAWSQDRDGGAPGGAFDATMVLHLWNQYSFSTTHKLAGDYAIVLLDKIKLTFHLLGGRQLLRFLYYHVSGNTTIITTSLYIASRLSDRAPRPDPATLVETAIFGHSLGEKTLWKGYSSLLPGEHVQLSSTSFIRKFWASQSDYLHNIQTLSMDEAVTLGAQALDDSIKHLTYEHKKARVPLFMGFDSRLILSLLSQRDISIRGITLSGPDIHEYEDVARIAGDASIPLTDVPLDDEFIAYFPDFGLHVIKLVDGFYSFERSFNPYMMYKTRDLANHVITGSIGGDLLQPFRKVGSMLTDLGYRILTSSNPTDTMNNSFGDIVANCPWIRESVFNMYFDEVLSSYWDLMGSLNDVLPPHSRFYYFLMKDSIRKWFGSQIMSERTSGIHLTPFWDDTFVQNVMSFPFTPVASSISGPSARNTIQAFSYYSKLIQMSNPKLLQAPTKYGFTPADLLNPLGKQKVKFQHLRKKWGVTHQRRKLPYEKWDREFLWKLLPRIELDDEIFDVTLMDDFEEGSWTADRLHYSRTASQAMTLAIWSGGIKEPWL